MKVVVTGGTGFLGYHLVPALLQAGHEVRLLKRPGSAHPKIKSYPSGVEAVELDFSDEAQIEKACHGFDAVIHAAGLVSYNLKDQQAMWNTHVDLTRKMLSAAKRAGVKRFVHVSSIVTLGHGKEARDESASFNAEGLRLAYWTTKRDAENEALQANAPEFEVVVVNPGSLLGVGEKGGQLLPFLHKLAKSERPFLPAGGSDFLSVQDAARGTVLALERGRAGERYVLGAQNLSYADFHRLLRRALGKSSRPRVLPFWLLNLVSKLLEAVEKTTKLDLPINSARLRRVNGVYMFHDVSKARRELGFKPGPLEPALTAIFEEESENL